MKKIHTCSMYSGDEISRLLTAISNRSLEEGRFNESRMLRAVARMVVNGAPNIERLIEHVLDNL